MSREFRFGTPSVSGFSVSQNIKFLKMCANIWLSHFGKKHVQESDSHQSASNREICRLVIVDSGLTLRRVRNGCVKGKISKRTEFIIIIVIIIFVHFSHQNCIVGFQNSAGFACQPLLYHSYTKVFLTIRHVLRVRIHRIGRRLGNFKVSCNFLG